ncbi:MAG: SMP-30/gluconolactonase/LRE family protein [Hyphomicrobiales bacterium]
MVGESLLWSMAERALYWVDICGRRIHRLELDGCRHQIWPCPEFPTSIALRARGGALVGLTHSVALWDFGERFESFATPEPGCPDNRLNEGRVDPQGRFWVGTMQTNLEMDGSPKAMTRSCGAIYRIGADGRIETMTAPDFGITNGFAWTDDGRFIAADTLKNEFYAYGCDAVAGLSAERQAFGSPFPRGLPDGSCLDADGFVWNCRVAGGGCVVRFAPGGAVDRVIDLPCSSPTSCAFGGKDLGTLFVTSARLAMTPEHLAQNPLEGGLFALDPGVKGRTEPAFAG